MTRIADPVLRAQIVADIRVRALAWRDQELDSLFEVEQRQCRARFAVLLQLATDLEDAA